MMLQSFVTVMLSRPKSTTNHRNTPARTRSQAWMLSRGWIKRSRLLAAIVFALTLVSTNVHASDYLIEVVVFKWKAGPAVEETFTTDSAEDSRPAAARATPNNIVQQVRPSLLVNAANGIQSAGAVDVLEHIGWTQSRAGQSGSPQIDMGAAAGSNLTGWVRLYTNTYLFAEIDLALRDETGALIRLKQRRRVKFNEVHYFDHPKFGVIVTISPNKS